ncbi:serine/threonine protein kinase [Planctomycetota bacterium]
MESAEQIPLTETPGTVIGRYKLLEKIGEGGMAVVYLAKQRRPIQRQVALKLIKLGMDSKGVIARFEVERQALAMMDHPNIAKLLDAGTTDSGRPYFVMEYVKGCSITRYCDNHKLNIEQRLRLFKEVCEALHHAHQAGLIHRDVKPKNILITKDGVAKLADMGLARAVSDREAAEAEAGKACGTPYYISPEQVRGAVDVDLRTDIYSFGATLYHMVTGKPAFSGSDTPTILRKHLRESLVPPDHINARLSHGFAEVIELCMAKDPAQRYATTTDLIQDLRAIANAQAPVFAHQSHDPPAAVQAYEDNDRDKPDKTIHERSLIAAPLFWIAIVGWFLAVVLLIVILT